MGRRLARSRSAAPTPTERSVRRTSKCPSIRRLPPPFPARANNYVVLGEVSYPFQATGIWFSVGAMTLHDSIIMIPRVASPITVQPRPSVLRDLGNHGRRLFHRIDERSLGQITARHRRIDPLLNQPQRLKSAPLCEALSRKIGFSTLQAALPFRRVTPQGSRG